MVEGGPSREGRHGPDDPSASAKDRAVNNLLISVAVRGVGRLTGPMGSGPVAGMGSTMRPCRDEGRRIGR